MDDIRRVLVIIPTYDEAENLPRIVPEVLKQDERIDVLVVDDASPDGTGEIADRLSEENERVLVLHRAGKEGLGRAYLAGFRYGLERGYDVLFEMDADFSHPPEALNTLLAAFDEADVVMGSRYVDGRVTVVNWPMSRLLISYFGSRYAAIITGMQVRDATGGFNGWKREVLEKVDLDRVQSNGYAFQIELKFRAWKAGFRMVEKPILFAERAGPLRETLECPKRASGKSSTTRRITSTGRTSWITRAPSSAIECEKSSTSTIPRQESKSSTWAADGAPSTSRSRITSIRSWASTSASGRSRSANSASASDR
jgi:dolichol-phosphate mannosyltransferase